MSTDSSQMGSHQNFSSFLETHKGIALGGGVILLLVVAGVMMKSKQSTTPATATTGDLSGLHGGIVYVPTQTSFSTQNIKYGAQVNSNDPNLTSVSGTQTVTGATTTTTKTTTNTGGTSTAPHTPPVPIPTPVTSKGLKWDTQYTILGGQTLSSIAAQVTRTLRAAGMPGSMSVTWHDLYAHNTNVINATSAAHHNPIPGGPWNDIFPGEVITIPRWA